MHRKGRLIMEHVPNDAYHVARSTWTRQLVRDGRWIQHRKNTIQGLFEVDVTLPRERLARYADQSGQKISFTAYIIRCMAEAINQHKHVHGYLDFRNRIMVFEDVDISCVVEIDHEGTKFTLLHIIRAANHKTLLDIHGEIRRVQTDPRTSATTQQEGAARFFARLPAIFRYLVYWYVMKRPVLWKRMFGTASVTAIGMFGRGGGWGAAANIYSIGIIVGGISEKPALVDGQLVARQYVNITLQVDHNVVDGAPAARFARTFQELLTSGYGLDVLD